MQQNKTLALTALAVMLAATPLALANDLERIDSPIQFLTGPHAGDAKEIATTYLLAQRENLGLTEQDLADMLVQDHYSSSRSGITHIYWRQRLDGVEVWNGDLAINVARDGSIINLNNGFVSDLAGKVQDRSPRISQETAVAMAAQALGLTLRSPLTQVESFGGPDLKVVFSDGGISRREIPVRLIYQPSEDRQSVRLAWDLSIERNDAPDWWSMRVDALSGELLSRYNWVSHAAQEGARAPQGVPADVYKVFPFPGENPDEIAHQQVTGPADANASPFGWHDTDGTAAPNFTDTRGNNVVAQDDRDGNNSGGTRPAGTGAGPLTFDYAFDAGSQPNGATNLEAAIVNLFYWNNVMHDITYQYGFDEPGGNFQENNYGNGGVGGDPVQADAQDGSGTNNANFATPQDGFDPRMQMFEWLPPSALTVNSPGGIAGTYDGGTAQFGPALTGVGTTGDLVYVDDGVIGSGTPPGTIHDGCEALGGGTLTGKVALIDRGFCEFSLKVLNAQNAGAIAAIIVNNQGDAAAGMGPGANGGAVTIPSLMIGQSNGGLIKAQLPSPGVNATLKLLTEIRRDSDNDAGIIAHEYGHGISNRLTGGPANTSCLSGAEQAGEGWSDFWALVLFVEPGDTALTPRAMGNYSIFRTESGGGIRNFPYSTDPVVSPLTYSDIATLNAPHGVGEVWAGALWNLHWELVTRYGWDPDLYNGTGGNNRLIQLVIDGMKLQACGPTMIAGRNAILLADTNNYAGANQCAIWRAFAARGMGTGASTSSTGVGDEVEDFSVPANCSAAIFTDGFETADTSAWSLTLP